MPTVPVGAVRRAAATIARYADVGMPPGATGTQPHKTPHEAPDDPGDEGPATSRVPAQKE